MEKKNLFKEKKKKTKKKAINCQDIKLQEIKHFNTQEEAKIAI